MVRPLTDISLDAMLGSIQRQRTLGNLPEELCLDLFQRVLSHGKLTPEVLALFVRTGHELVLECIEDLHLQMPPPVLPTGRGAWLGDKPRLF
mmetsp:Transcript_15673/g.47261  ORF Transcript_15673/g.47261 Transcript_15673/m.47261 type:complete len:92 (-) Transcript_15673:309-584(-)